MKLIRPVKEQTMVDVEELKNRIFEVSYLDRITMLLGSVVDRERQATATMDGMLAPFGRMSATYNPQNRIRLAETFRSIADEIDHGMLDDADIITLRD